MGTTTGFKDIIDLPEWRPIANSFSTSGSGSFFCNDPRNNADRHPEVFKLWQTQFDNARFERYNVKNDDWLSASFPGGGGSSAATVFCPSQGPRGTLAGGATTTSVVLSTVLPTAIGVNQLANRGDGRGYKIRIVDNAGGASGKTEERIIIGNTGGTTPTIYLDSALSFTPTAGSTYEFLSGRVYIFTPASSKYYDVIFGTFTTISTVGFNFGNNGWPISLDELCVPVDRNPGEGFFGNLIATATGATTLTGQVATGDSAVLINEYRNFQIRIVQDLATPTAVGQRRRITSHTAGVSPVYTVPAWTVTPSATATYVIEQDNDKILWWAISTNTTYNYNIIANTWDTTTWVNRTNGFLGPVLAMPSYGLAVSDLGTGKEVRHSFIYTTAGDLTSHIDLFDIAGGATGSYTPSIIYGGTPFICTDNTDRWNTGTHGTYDPATNKGHYFYLNIDNSQHYARFDVKNRVLENWCFRPFPSLHVVTPLAGTGNRMASALFVDGATKLAFIISARFTAAPEVQNNEDGREVFQIVAQR